MPKIKIPGVSSYQEHNHPADKNKRAKKNRRKKEKSLQIKNEPETSSKNSELQTNNGTAADRTAKKIKNKAEISNGGFNNSLIPINKKRKLEEIEISQKNSEFTSNNVEEPSASPSKKPKKVKKNKNKTQNIPQKVEVVQKEISETSQNESPRKKSKKRNIKNKAPFNEEKTKETQSMTNIPNTNLKKLDNQSNNIVKINKVPFANKEVIENGNEDIKKKKSKKNKTIPQNLEEEDEHESNKKEDNEQSSSLKNGKKSISKEEKKSNAVPNPSETSPLKIAKKLNKIKLAESNAVDNENSRLKTGRNQNKKREVESDKNNDDNEESTSFLAKLLNISKIDNSSSYGESLFEYLISPTPLPSFFAKNWEKEPLYIQRSDERDYYSWLFSSAEFDILLRKNVIKFSKNLDITSYSGGVRETHNPEGRAFPTVVWDYYANGCSVRMLNPQTYSKNIWRLNSGLQEYFGTFVGANVYLTPPNSQGFAPHYDDIEAFILQLEGSKHWKLYKPRTKDEKLPRTSSLNFNEETDGLGSPILEVTLGPGDCLYFPRGTIHQAHTTEEHSLHLTISAYQANSYADFIKIYLQNAVEKAASESVSFRKGLPMDYLTYMGIVHSDTSDKNFLKKRQEFTTTIRKLCTKILEESCDSAADQMGKKLNWDALPPYLTPGEKKCTAFRDGEFMSDGKIYNRTEIEPDTQVRIIRQHAVRLLVEEEALRLYFNSENSLEYHGEENQFLEIPFEAGPVVEHLLKAYPNFTKVEHLPLDDEELKVQVVSDMWEKGLLITHSPLSPYLFDSLPEEDSSSNDYFSEEDGDSEEEEEESDDFNDSVLRRVGCPDDFSDTYSEEESEEEEDREFINDEEEDVEEINLSDLEEEEDTDEEDFPPILI